MDYSDIAEIREQLEEYLEVPEEAVKQLKVFEAEHLIGFLERVVDEYNEFRTCCVW